MTLKEKNRKQTNLKKKNVFKCVKYNVIRSSDNKFVTRIIAVNLRLSSVFSKYLKI